MLKVRNLNKIINKREVLSDISLEFTEGLYPILGRNGSGKTTLFQCISGDMKFESGDITISDNEESKAMLAHKHGVLPINLTGYQFIQFVCDNAITTEQSVKERIDGVFEIVKISEETRYTLIKDYDFINKRKLQLAQFLVQKPYVIMFDEPFDFREDTYMNEFLETLNSFKDEHIILISTGLLEIARKIAGDVIVLNDGHADFIDKASLKNKKTQKKVLELMGEDEDEE